MYAPRDYYFEARTLYDAIEESTDTTVSQEDTGITSTMWAHFISRARLDVMIDALKQQRQIVNVRREEITLPGGGNHNLAPPGSILRHVPLAVTLVEGQRNGQYFPLDHVAEWERYLWENANYLGAAAFPGVWNYEGSTLRLFPDPGSSLTMRVTYVPMPERYTREDLDREAFDDVVPAVLQPMVPARACFYAQRRDRQDIDSLLAVDASQIAVLATLRNAAAPEHIVYTGACE